MDMKRLILIMMLPLALAVGCTHKGGAPAEGSLYERYASLPETSVAQVCGFLLRDSVRVDVVAVNIVGERNAKLRHLLGAVTWDN